MSLIVVDQDTYVLIQNHSADKNVYVTRGVGNCFAFGITFSDDHGTHAIFAHYSPKCWTPGYHENSYFEKMVKELDGKKNITVEVVTAMMEGTKHTTGHAKNALPDVDSIKFYIANPTQGGSVDVYFYPKHAVLWGDPTTSNPLRRGVNDRNALENVDSFDQHLSPRACGDIITKDHTKKVSCHCIIL